jgi:hypothetical protein
MAGSAADVRKLRDELEARFGNVVLPAGAPVPERTHGFRTGVAAVDALLPDGVPRGALSLWTGETTAGRTAALRALVLTACAGGARVALIDAELTLDAGFARNAAGAVDGLWVVRPPDAGHTAEGAWAAEMLLRAGVFDLVILDGHLPDAAQAHRLRALARERDAAVVVSATQPLPAGYQLSAISDQSGTIGQRPPAEDRELRTEDLPHSRTHAPRTHALGFRPDVRLEFGRAEGVRSGGLRPGGRFRQRVRVRLDRDGRGGASTRGGEREVELEYEPTDRLCMHPPVADRSTGRR